MNNHSQQKPGVLTAISILILVGGAWAGLIAFTITLSFFAFTIGTLGVGLLAGPFVAIPIILWGAAAVIALINGIKGLTGSGSYSGFLTSSIILIICILGCDVVSLVLGIISLILLMQEDVKRYFGRT
jgi:hypothetical protein